MNKDNPPYGYIYQWSMLSDNAVVQSWNFQKQPVQLASIDHGSLAHRQHMKITLTAWLRKQMRWKIKVWSITKVRGLSKTRADELSTCSRLLWHRLVKMSRHPQTFLSLPCIFLDLFQTFGDVGCSCRPIASVSNSRTCNMDFWQ